MKKLTGIFLFITAFISIVTGIDVVQHLPCNDNIKILTGSYLEEEHILVGDLEIKDQSRTNSVHLNYKNFLNQFLSCFSADYFNYNLKINSAKGFLLLKKHLALIYVFHNFW